MRQNSLAKLRHSYDKVLVIDDREPLDFAEQLAMHCTIPIDIRRLKTGDYVIDDVAIERKLINDFAASIIDKRLKNQAIRLKKEFKYPYILIQGGLPEVDSEINPHSLLGAMAKLLVYYQIPTLKIDSEDDLAYLILKIFENHNKLRLTNGFK
jgi:ERCC4-type nuclease